MTRRWLLLGAGLWLWAIAGCGSPTDPGPPHDLEGTLPSPPNGEGGGGGEATPTPPPMMLTRTRIGIDRQNMMGPPEAWRLSVETGQAQYTLDGATVNYTWSVPPAVIASPTVLTYQGSVTAPPTGRGLFEILISASGMLSVPPQVRQAEAEAENGRTATARQTVQLAPNNERWPDDAATITVHLRFGPRIIYNYTYADIPATNETPGP